VRNNTEGKNSRKNFFTPLQAISDDEPDTDGELEVSAKPKKIVVPPIKVLNHDIDFIRRLLIAKNINKFLLKKISIGVKIVSENIDSLNLAMSALKEKNVPYYTHDRAENKSFKVVLFGLDNKSSDEVKSALIALNLKCTDVKAVTKTYENYKDTLYIVTFEIGSVRLDDLRRNVKALFKTIVRWEHKRKSKNNVVQCRNCQMYGHGERGCSIKTKCAVCAGGHRTTDCNNENRERCANCNGSHKSTDLACPNRLMYLDIRETIKNKNNRHARPSHSSSSSSSRHLHTGRSQFSFVDSEFPLLPSTRPSSNSRPQLLYSRQEGTPKQSSNENSDLFSEQEITQLTLDIVTNLSSCKSKEDQFNVIAQLAIKYLYSKKN